MKAKDIASLLGVSPSTVSLVINNKPGVGDAMRTKIIRKIKELGCEYLLKDSPVNNKNIGFVVYKRYGNIINEMPFFSYILENINNRIKEYGYTLLFVHINKEMSVKEQKKELLSANCEGHIVFATEMLSDDLDAFYESKLPFVILDNFFLDRDADCVSVNNKQGIYKAVKYLVDKGHTSIGYIRSKIFINSFKERFNAYLECLNSFGLEKKDDYIATIQYSKQGSYEDMKKYIESTKNFPTAFVADNDLLAFEAIKAFKEKGYSIPEDFSIVGFDDRPLCSMSDPEITTLAIPKDTFGSSAVDILINKLNKPRNHYFNLRVGTVLVERGSCMENKKILSCNH